MLNPTPPPRHQLPPQPPPPARCAPPQPPPGDCIGAVSTLMTLVLASGVVLTLVGGSFGHTRGSTRSARLEFEQNRAERLAEMERDESAAAPIAAAPKAPNP